MRVIEMHLEDAQIQGFLHGELDPRETDVAITHSASCAECRLRLEEAEREEEQIFDLLRRIDHAAPAIDAAGVIARARGGAAVARLGWAAGIVLALVVASAVYATPGSPLAAWVSRFVEMIERPAPRPAPIVQPAPAATGGAGIAVAPGKRFVIHFTTTQAEGIATVSLTDGPDIAVRATSGSATFTSGIARLTIDNEGSSASYQIDVPRDAPRLEIRVGHRRTMLKEGDQIVTDGERDARGRYVVHLAPRGR